MWWGRSRCPACGTTLRPRDLVPLLSWLWQRGRCRHCGAPVSAWYPAVELAAAAVGAASPLLLPTPEALVAVLLGWWLLALALIDLEAWILPDALTLPLILAGLLLAAAGGAAPGRLPLASLGEAAAGAALGYVVLAGVAWAYRRLRRREGLGLGDAKLFAGAGAWLGAASLPVVMLTAALLGLAFAVLRRQPLRAESAVPFGPALAVAFWAWFLLLARG
jgi:leader peptidase (prepilin peptidase)/N-methyltransferase